MSQRIFQNSATGFQAYTNLNKFRKSGRFTDLQIEVEGGRYVDAHRAVLAERIPFLEGMLSSATNEGAVFKLSWPRFPKSIVEDLLTYIYEGAIILNANNVQRLYLLAFMMDYDELRKMCLEFMGSTMTEQKLQTYLKVARAIGSDDLYKMLFSKLSYADNLPETFNEDEVVRFLRISKQSSDRQLEMISEWSESNKDILNKADSIFDMFKRFLGHIDATKLSHSAIDKFMWSDSLFVSNHECRLYLKTFSSKPSPQLFPRLLVYGMSKDDNNMGIISTVNQFTEVSHTAVNLRISYFDFRRAASLNGIVYVVGGRDDEDQRLATVTEIDIETGVVSVGQPMLMARTFAAVATSSDEVFVCGGFNNNQGRLNTCERLRPAISPCWSAMSSLAQKRNSAAAVVLGADQQLLVTGGFDGKGALSSSELLNLPPQQSSEWIAVAPMLHARHGHGMCIFRGSVVVAGGSGNLNSAEVFSAPQTAGDLGQWTELKRLSQIEGPASLAVWKDRLLAFAETGCQIEELFNPIPGRTNSMIEDNLPQFTWRPVGDLSENLKYVESVVVEQNKMKT